MTKVLMGIMAGWLAVSAPVVAESKEVKGPSDQQWRERLLAVQEDDSWFVGAQIGMELVQIPGDRPYEILASNWPKIVASARKQILKGFTPGMMGNKKIHPRFFDVMHLGMADQDAGVRSYAAVYIKRQGLPNFEHDEKGYARWREQNKDRTAKEIVSKKSTNPSGQADDVVEDADALTAEGWKLWQERNMVAAEEKFSEAVKLDPDATDAWNGLGWSRFNGGQSERAVEAFGKCVALEPKHPAALNGLGQVYLMWKDYDRAEKYLLLAAPQAPAAHYGLAKVYLLQEKFKKARPWAEKIAASNPKDVGSQQMLAAAKAGKLDDELRKLIEPLGKPKLHSADAAHGWQMFQSGRMRTAERLFRRVLENDKENLSATNGLAFCLLNQGKHEQAKPLFEQCLSLEKDAGGPMNGLARCLKAEGKVDEAIALWETMTEKSSGPAAATTGLAQAYLERKEYAKSVKYYKILVDSAPNNKAFQRGLANAEKGLASSGGK